MNRVARSVLAVALVGGGLVACTPDEAPPVTRPTSSAPVETPTPTPTPSPSPSVSAVVDVTVAPERPDALDADEPSKEGAVASGKYFLSLFPYVSASGDLSAWNAMSDPKCKFCASVRDGVKSANDAGEHDVGGALAFDDEVGREVVAGATYEVALDVAQEASQTVDSTGKAVESFPGPKFFRATLVIEWSDRGWMVRGVQVDAKS
ncbi:DUF6318 family protein [Cellulomonas sp. PhB150]|uniref:DUF6318 family protein n=1 Tax=Cellulomonas sp. PhB150 TaxID=2485188 RepID=UPI000F4666C4|nr:DUF6318 family protein [Cellulomonas sp. PhB150]ROS30744.1 hypothetical protein EDF34_0383 [Cellulomonas sp. PhB150]